MKLFEDLPSQNTPITAEMLNQIQDNLVVVSATEPTGDNREKVWVQYSKNLFDKDNVNIIYGYIMPSSNSYIVSGTDTINKSLYMICKPNTTYTISKVAGKRFRVASSSVIPSNNSSLDKIVSNNEGTSITISTGNESKYLIIYYMSTNEDTLTEEEILNSIQVELGNTATEYEVYAKSKIYVKKDNDVYEEFINVNQLEELTQQVYNLGLGQTINNNQDLNALTTAGVYVSPNAGVSATLKNNPIPDAGFKLVVEYTVQEKTRVKQTMHVNNTYCTTLVRYYNGTWGKWYTLGLTEYTAST